jgi:magnesium-transporting ATPase (P-type)
MDTTAIDSLFNELRELQSIPLTSDTRVIYKEREKLIKQQIIKEVLPDTSYVFSIPFKMASVDSVFNSELLVTIDFVNGVITHTATSEPVKMPYTSSSYSVSVERLNAWSKWMFLILVVITVFFVVKKVFL